MREKFEFLLSLRLLECEIKEVTSYSQSYNVCYKLLRIKLEHLYEFMIEEETIRRWDVWGEDKEIQKQSERVREAAVKALCDLEKYQSKCISRNQMEVNQYLTTLFQSVKAELQNFGIDSQSKVLFIGSGAFPVSVLTIAKKSGAQVMGVDIDSESVQLASHAAKAYGLERQVKFSDEKLNGIAFLKEATHIIIASLVPNKNEVLLQLKEEIRGDVKILLRYGNGVKSIFNYPFDCSLSDEEWLQRRHIEQNLIYDIIILEKSTSQNSKQVITL